MFLFISFLVYSSCIFDIVLIGTNYAHMFAKRLVQFRIRLGGRRNISVVFILGLPVNAPYILGQQVVDHGSDSLVESSVVHSPNIGQVEPGCKEGIALFLIFLSNVPYE
jgi:hypothetical protein